MENNNDFILSINPVKQLTCYCGPACIEMVLRYYNIEGVKQDKIGKEMNIAWREGCFPFQVIRYLNKYKIICRKDRSRKRALDYFRKTKQPIILGEIDHFTLLIGQEKNKLIIVDPYYGKQKIKNYSYLQKINEYLIMIEAGGINYEKETK